MEPKAELQRNAIADARRIELETFQRALDTQWLNSRMEGGRMGQCLALIQREAEMEKDLQERTDHAAIVNARMEKETALGTEIAKLRHKEICEQLRRQYLRECDPGLRELIRKLQAGYVCRDLRQQILHNEYKKLQEKVEERHAYASLSNALYSDEEARALADQRKLEQTTQYKHELQQQLVNRQRQRQCHYEESLIEKKMLEDVMRAISEEDKKEIELKILKTQKVREEMVMSKQAREAWRKKQKALVVLEERKLEEQQKALSDRSTAVIADRSRKLQERDARNEKITTKILADEAERHDRENIIRLLQEQELLEKNVLDENSERKKVERTKSDTKEALQQQMNRKKQQDKEQKQREEEYRKFNESMYAAEEVKEQEKNQRLREKKQMYAAELRKQIEDNSRKREKEMRLEASRDQNLKNYYDSWRTEVAQERSKIVEEHVPSLMGYFQPGAVQVEDLPALRAGAARENLDLKGLGERSASGPQTRPKCNAQCRVLREY